VSEKKRKINVENVEMVEGKSNTTPQAGLYFVHKFFAVDGQRSFRGFGLIVR
jgi:hypothetical protein